MRSCGFCRKKAHNAQTCPLARDLYKQIRAMNERISPLGRVARSYLQNLRDSKSLVKFLAAEP